MTDLRRPFDRHLDTATHALVEAGYVMCHHHNTQPDEDTGHLTCEICHNIARFDAKVVLNTVAADIWDEGAQTAWDRSTPEVNGQRYHWRHEGEPTNPYRKEAGR